MKSPTSIKIKALVLLIVFFLNTAIGFACGLGVDMGFNGNCYPKNLVKSTAGQSCGNDKTSHDHLAGKKQHHHGKKSNCCNDGVIKFQLVDKNLSGTVDFVLSPIALIAIVPNYICIDMATYKPVSANKQTVPFFHPPPPDIRVFIQSFQI